MKSDLKSGEFLHLLREIQAGSEPIDSLLMHPEFKRKTMLICQKFQMKAEYSAEDLYQDVCLKVFNHQDTLRNPDNIPGKKAFFSWLSAVARNAFYNEIRKTKLLINTLSVEEIDIADPGIKLDGQVLLSEFEEFIKALPEGHQRAVKLWLTECSYREIGKILNDEGIKNTHVTVRTWIKDALSGFVNRSSPVERKSSRKRA
jgi:RNA polymerase sigma factor (sigma-70 family)